MAYANSSSDVSVFYANSRSLVNKTDQLELEIATYQYDLMVFMETHLDSSILDSELFLSIYTVFRFDLAQNGRPGGGILIAVPRGAQTSRALFTFTDQQRLTT